MTALADLGQGLRTAVGTLTVLPVGPAQWDRPTMRWAMALAPVAGFVLACFGGALLAAGLALGASPAVSAVASVGVLALLTRGLHLDGLADLADGLGSARPAAEAVEVMRRSDIGPFGVITLLITLGIQVTCIAQLGAADPLLAVIALLVALLGGRLAITLACRSGVPAARPDGLGHMVSSVLSTGVVLFVTALVIGVSWAVGLLAPGYGVWAPVAVGIGVGAAETLRWYAVRRLGGITGDVLGALSEAATTVTLLVAVLIAA